MSTLTVAREPVRADVLEAARDFVSSVNVDYVAYPVTAYQMNIIIGQWDFTTYTFEKADIYAISYVPSSGNVSSYLRLNKQAGNTSGNLDNPYSVLTYSSAAHSVNLVDKGGIVIATAAIFGFAILLCWFIVRDIFANVSRH